MEDGFPPDLKADPYEQDNLIDHLAYGKVRKVMKERLLKRMKEIKGKSARIIPAKEREPSGQRVVFDYELDE